MKIIHVVCLLVLLKSLDSKSQEIKYGDKTFTNIQVAEAQISNEKLFLKISELDTYYNGKEQDGDLEPNYKSILVEIEFKGGFSFPIRPEDSVQVSFTALEQGLEELRFDSQQLETVNDAALKQEGKVLQVAGDSAEEKTKQIAEKLMKGEITPEEAEKQILAIANPMLSKVENSSAANIGFEEYNNKKDTFSVFCRDTEEEIESELVSGTLYIKSFNRNYFEAYFEGVEVVFCLEKRAARSKSEELNCGAITSQYLPETKLLREGSIKGKIKLQIKEFLDNR